MFGSRATATPVLFFALTLCGVFYFFGSMQGAWNPADLLTLVPTSVDGTALQLVLAGVAMLAGVFLGVWTLFLAGDLWHGTRDIVRRLRNGSASTEVSGLLRPSPRA